MFFVPRLFCHTFIGKSSPIMKTLLEAYGLKVGHGPKIEQNEFVFFFFSVQFIILCFGTESRFFRVFVTKSRFLVFFVVFWF